MRRAQQGQSATPEFLDHNVRVAYHKFFEDWRSMEYAADEDVGRVAILVVVTESKEAELWTGDGMRRGST